MMKETDKQSMDIANCVKLIRAKTNAFPTVAIILGSGLGGLADKVISPVEFPYGELPGMPKPTAHGHAGKLLIGQLGQCCVAVFAGRSHLYEGHAVETTIASVRLAAALGADLCIASNAAGGLNPRFQTGDLVAIDSHINLFYQQMPISDCIQQTVDQGQLHRASTPLYDLNLIATCTDISRNLGFTLHRGTYLGTSGPTYETRAEYRAFRTMGADMVGMSTILEMLTASQLGMRTLAFSVITNVANPDQPTQTTHEEVLDVAKVAQDRLLPLVEALLNSGTAQAVR
jgi:purine-nucleoside phosphorylase